MQQSDPKGFYDAISGKATGAEDQNLGAKGQDHRCPGKAVLRQKKLLPQNTDERASDQAALNKKAEPAKAKLVAALEKAIEAAEQASVKPKDLESPAADAMQGHDLTDTGCTAIPSSQIDTKQSPHHQCMAYLFMTRTKDRTEKTRINQSSKLHS